MDSVILPDSQKQIIPQLLEVCPEFQDRWKKHVEWWGGKEAGIYNDLAEFVHFIVSLYDQGDTERFGDIFGAVERMLAVGDERVKEALAFGFLETLQCAASWKSFGKKAFVSWLGPISAQYWTEIERMWEGKTSLMDVIRAERKQ